MAVKLFEFNSAVRGYHYFQKYWEPEANQELDCAHVADNPYDYFAIKTCTRGSNGRTVGHGNIHGNTHGSITPFKIYFAMRCKSCCNAVFYKL